MATKYEEPKIPPELSEEDVQAIRRAGEAGDEAEQKRIIESRGLTWLDGREEKSQFQQHDE